MIELEILPGLKLSLDPAKYELQSGYQLAGTVSAENILTVDLAIHDVLEDNDSKATGIAIIRTKP